ncbi:putative Protein arginine N-methyltransferase 5 protein [Naja naja]|nr:putative Protein arginine N-methyltransferase 5 protein [Naja naja]
MAASTAAAMAAAAAAASSAVGPGTAGVARVSCGRDLSCVPEVVGTLGAVARQGFDFLCMPIFHPRYKREFFQEPAKHRPGPQTRSDLLLSGRDWGTLIVGKLSPWIRADSKLEKVRRNSEAFWMRVPLLDPEDLRDDVFENEAVPGVEDESAGEEKTWQCAGGWPRPALEVQIIITGAHHHPEKEFCSYLQYLEYLSQNRPPPSAYELFAKGYEDYLQSPLQPLMDNLESQTYEVFEKDPIKYSQYQQVSCQGVQAIYKCLLDMVRRQKKTLMSSEVVMVLGAGRGPLVNASLQAALQAKRRIKIYAVEKNPNAVVT